LISLVIADDNTLFRTALMHFLKKEKDIEVLYDAKNGNELIEKLKTISPLPNIILMDINMPILDGKEATKTIKSIFPSIKIIALSVFNHEHLVNSMLQLGARGYLSKTVEPEFLKNAIYTVNEGKYFIETSTGIFKIYKKLPMCIRELNLDDSFIITDKQKIFLQHCAEGKSYCDIAKLMHISEKTANKYREALCNKFNVSNRGEMINFAIQNGLIKILNF
jgi:DNA-binding NarL/FixJ family response regulator